MSSRSSESTELRARDPPLSYLINFSTESGIDFLTLPKILFLMRTLSSSVNWSEKLSDSGKLLDLISKDNLIAHSSHNGLEAKLYYFLALDVIQLDIPSTSMPFFFLPKTSSLLSSNHTPPWNVTSPAQTGLFLLRCRIQYFFLIPCVFISFNSNRSQVSNTPWHCLTTHQNSAQ